MGENLCGKTYGKNYFFKKRRLVLLCGYKTCVFCSCKFSVSMKIKLKNQRKLFFADCRHILKVKMCLSILDRKRELLDSGPKL